MEHYAFTKFIPKDFNYLVSKYCSGVMIYEDYAVKTGKVGINLKEIKEEQNRGNWSGKIG